MSGSQKLAGKYLRTALRGRVDLKGEPSIIVACERLDAAHEQVDLHSLPPVLVKTFRSRKGLLSYLLRLEVRQATVFQRKESPLPLTGLLGLARV